MNVSQPKPLHPFYFQEFKQDYPGYKEWSEQKILMEFMDYLRFKKFPEAQIVSLSSIYVLKSLGVV